MSNPIESGNSNHVNESTPAGLEGEVAETRAAMEPDLTSAEEGFEEVSSGAESFVATEASSSAEFTEEVPGEGAEAEAILAQLAEKVESLQMQLDERTNQYKRLVADFDNFRKRTEKEKEDLDNQVKRKTLSELLPVVDSFDLARTQIKPQTEAETSIHKSYQGVYKQLVDCLKRIGVAPMRPEGKPFDPTMHEAVLREPTDEYPEGTVLEELKRGYLLGDRVLRYAMVKVAAAPEGTDKENESQAE
uniref:Protein GrpE n=1 Tax=Cyanothece sp. (strain PCC 7425 / ATCC 29141) TaxID=395961 RepID=B8HLD4_CYAP4